MKNQRKLKRRELIFNLKIRDFETDEPIGWLVDITAEGLKMTGTTILPVDQNYLLAIELPEEIFGKQEIHFSAKVLWSRPDVNADLNATGMLFTNILEEDHQTLFGLMTKFSLNDYTPDDFK